MTWASLLWRLGVLWRMHRRRARITWYLWRRSRRPAPVRPYYMPELERIMNAEIGAPIRVRGREPYITTDPANACDPLAIFPAIRPYTDDEIKVLSGAGRT